MNDRDIQHASIPPSLPPMAPTSEPAYDPRRKVAGIWILVRSIVFACALLAFATATGKVTALGYACLAVLPAISTAMLAKGYRWAPGAALIAEALLLTLALARSLLTGLVLWVFADFYIDIPPAPEEVARDKAYAVTVCIATVLGSLAAFGVPVFLLWPRKPKPLAPGGPHA